MRPKNLLFAFFALALSLEYLEKIEVGPFSGLDCIGMTLPILLIIKAFVFNRGSEYQLSKDITIHIFYVLIFTLFVSGLIANVNESASFGYTLGRWAKFLNGFVIFLITSSIITNYKDLGRMCICMFFSLMIPSLLFFFQLCTGDLIRKAGGMVPDVYLTNPHLVAYGAVVVFPIILYKFSMATALFQKTIWCGVLSLNIILVYFSFSRTGWLGMAAEFIVFLSMLKGRHFLYALALTLFSVILLSFTPVASRILEDLNNIPVLFSNLSGAFSTDNFDYLFSGRWHIIRLGLTTFLQRDALTILIGDGIGGSGGHNIYLPLLTDFGLINFSLFMLLFGLLYHRAFLLMKSENLLVSKFGATCLSVTTGYLVMGLSTHIFYYMSSGVWLFWGIQGGLIGMLSDRKASKKTSGMLTGITNSNKSLTFGNTCFGLIKQDLRISSYDKESIEHIKHSKKEPIPCCPTF